MTLQVHGSEPLIHGKLLIPSVYQEEDLIGRLSSFPKLVTNGNINTVQDKN